MVTVADVLSHLFPQSLNLRDWVVSEGQIVAWRLPEPQPTAQEISAATPQAQAYADAAPTRAAQQAKTEATAGVDRGAQQAGNATERKIVALVGLILDEFNTHAARQSVLVAQILAASSLADLKTRVTANVNPIPQRTRAQLIGAIKNKIAETGE